MDPQSSFPRPTVCPQCQRGRIIISWTKYAQVDATKQDTVVLAHGFVCLICRTIEYLEQQTDLLSQNEIQVT